MSTYGEGEIRVNKAVNYLCKMVRIAQKQWGLSDEAMEIVLWRVLKAEHPTYKDREFIDIKYRTSTKGALKE